MAFHLGIRQSRVACYSVPGILEPSSFSFINKKSITNQAWNHKNNYGGSNKGSNQGNKWANAFKLGAAGGLSALAFTCAFPKNDLLAESDDEEHRIIDQENRIRQYTKIGTIFDYFATFKLVRREATAHSDEKAEILMSVKDFYNAVVPGSSVTHGYGRGHYEVIPLKELTSQKTYQAEKLPIDRNEGSVLNDIQKHGLLSYVDFCFLLNILSTPRRYIDIVFHCFDVSADGLIECKEFAHVMAEVIHFHGDPEALISGKHSGLLDYFFGKERTKSIDKDFILNFQERLINDVLWLEFTRYDPKGIAISDEDFCNHLLLCANFTNKKKKQMINRVKKHWDAKPATVGFEEFRDFYKVLFGGADLERAMFYLNKAEGIDSDEFASVAKWVTGKDVCPHIVELIYVLLDDDEDHFLSVKEFSPVLFQWRHARGFHHQALGINLGRLRI